MSFEHPKSDKRFSRSIINLQDHCSSNIMEGRSRKVTFTNQTPATSQRVERRKMEYQRSISHGNGKSWLFSASYFSLESFVLLICLTASLLILPLILPPLPPPPFSLLLLPIGILAVLMILAFMPTNARDMSFTYV
ncbi:ARGOS-like protein [Manihot esculenta]|uniref:Uncharacterized protein n=2 Tax=Manihot esculenta TaxID=3983 RepID=A0ACB7I9D5_MANES|nr:ARGOS-like protein [Manihot esculenta]KAG8661496.1 hypothetical protein MANES_01G009500v8 [Manihot esculenta]KAG8661497.1 hypothetical protein MANES_01G009500v8 [Manihot esculenta]